ncbi:MaoC family dehydratase [Variovorax sp. YR216]|uniref:MaoC family dehydratase n=1 Tax=Variovorax sp. YR216 TaxID=1882828 RepID=UPI0008999FEA|nr:MaoC family dehydratase [Variovorax sp. YR216]SEA85854.1 Acyl dehydratase [Variovorax sp. YR216]
MDIVISSPEHAFELKGKSLGNSQWLRITQEDVNQFARLTGDSQWIHVDPERAAAGPFGACVAHGQFTLSLAGGRFFHELVRTTAKSGINYGLDRVRFPAPVRVGRQVRAEALVQDAGRLGESGVQLYVRITVEVEGEERPACVADFIARYEF